MVSLLSRVWGGKLVRGGKLADSLSFFCTNSAQWWTCQAFSCRLITVPHDSGLVETNWNDDIIEGNNHQFIYSAKCPCCFYAEVHTLILFLSVQSLHILAELYMLSYDLLFSTFCFRLLVYVIIYILMIFRHIIILYFFIFIVTLRRFSTTVIISRICRVLYECFTFWLYRVIRKSSVSWLI